MYAELALKEEELKKTRQILKEVTNEKEELSMKVTYILFSFLFTTQFKILDPIGIKMFILLYCSLFIYFNIEYYLLFVLKVNYFCFILNILPCNKCYDNNYFILYL